MNWEKAGPVCTPEQALDLFDELVMEWPERWREWERMKLLDKAIERWTGRFREWPYRYAKAAVTEAIDQSDGRWPRWSEILDAMNKLGLRDQNEGTPD